MRRIRTPILVLLAAALPLLQGCRTLGLAHRETAVVEIDNNVPLPTAFTVYAFSDVGSRQMIGSLSPGRPAALRFIAGQISGRYRFTAMAQRGTAITSAYVALNGGETVTWDLRNNVILVAR